MAGKYALWRQDDNGHKSMVTVSDSRTDLEQFRTRLERYNHKQFYWIAENK